jgi:hypothetical protein
LGPPAPHPYHSAVVRRSLLPAAVVALGAFVLAGCGEEGAQAAEAPSKVTVAGDSISFGLGSSLREAVDPAVTVKVIGESGTGMARPDRLDWPSRLEELARDFPPDVLVFSVGSNDNQDLTDASGEVVATRADGWEQEYTRRLARAFDAFEATGSTVLWVGQVRTEEPGVAESNREVHRIASELASDRDWVEVRDLALLTGSGDDETSRCLIADGLHLSVECYEEAAGLLVSELG